jgi:hypothetical protein
VSLRLEAFLARIYVDESAREAYLADPEGEAARAGLEAADCAALRRVNPAELRLAARSFAWKRGRARGRHALHDPWRALRRLIGRRA